MVAVNVVTFGFLILVVSHNTEGESPWRSWTVPYLPAEGPPGAWSVSAFGLRDLNTVTIGDLPARFDWSIIGWTILLLALMNLQRTQRRRKRTDRGREGGRAGGERRRRKICQCISLKQDQAKTAD